MDCSPPGSSLSMGFSRQEYWSGLPFPPAGDLPRDGTHVSCLLRWQVGSLPLVLPGKPGSSNNLLEKTETKRQWGQVRNRIWERRDFSPEAPERSLWAHINTRWLLEVHQYTASLITAHTLFKSLTKSDSLLGNRSMQGLDPSVTDPVAIAYNLGTPWNHPRSF